MGGAASLLKKKEKTEEDELQTAEASGHEEERENAEANTTTNRPSAFASLKKRATNVAKNALAKVGLAEEADVEPDDEEEGDRTPQKQAPVAQDDEVPLKLSYSLRFRSANTP